MSPWLFGRRADLKRPRSGAPSELESPGATTALFAPASNLSAHPESSSPSRLPQPTEATTSSASTAFHQSSSSSYSPALKKRRTNANSATNTTLEHQSPHPSRSARLGAASLSPPPPHDDDFLPHKAPPSARRPSNNNNTAATATATATAPRTTTFAPSKPEHGAGDASRPKSLAHNISRNSQDGLGSVPTLHNRRNSEPAKSRSRRRSSRWSRKDANRDRDSTNAAASDANRLAVDDLMSRGLIKRDSKRVKSGFSFGRNSQCSVISLPTPDSIHSSLLSDAQHGFQVSALDSLSPCPTLRCSGPSHASVRRPPSQRKHLNAPISAQALRAHKHVDGLADNLDAAELRDILERDKRRRDKKLQRERDRAELRLSRRAAAQKSEHEHAIQMGFSPPRNMHQGVHGREPHDDLQASSPIWSSEQDPTLSADDAHIPRFSFQRERPDSTMRYSSEQQRPPPPPPPPPPPRSASNSQAGQLLQPTVSDWEEPTMLATDVNNEQLPPVPESPPDAVVPLEEEWASPPLSSVRQAPTPPASPRDVSSLKRKQTNSRSSLASERGKFTVVKLPRLDDDENAAVSSPAAAVEKAKPEKNRKRAISALFRWPSRKNRAPATPPSFSVTSRSEAMAAAQSRAQGSAQSNDASNPMRNIGSTVPKRTRSRFKEDLPEHPLSPPSSRLQSPEADAGTTNGGPSSLQPHETRSHEYLTVHPLLRHGTPVSGHRVMDDTMRRVPVSASFASVDTEASWFAGRKSPASRAVSRGTQHPSPSPSVESLIEDASDSNVTSHDYPLVGQGSVGGKRPSNDAREEEETETTLRTIISGFSGEAAKWGDVEARQQPQVIKGRQGRVIKSFQGLLFEAPSDPDASSSPTEPAPSAIPAAARVDSADNTDASSDSRRSIISTGSAILSRARSIIFGKAQPRPISIGSAKLLDTAQASGAAAHRPAQRRRSTGSKP